MSETIMSGSAPEPVGAYPHAKRVGNLLFLFSQFPAKFFVRHGRVKIFQRLLLQSRCSAHVLGIGITHAG